MFAALTNIEDMRLGIGETLIPLGALRKRLAELPADKNTEICATAKYPCAAMKPPLCWRPMAGKMCGSWRAASWPGPMPGKNKGRGGERERGGGGGGGGEGAQTTRPAVIEGMCMKTYDIIIAGAGPGGLGAALKAASLGLKAALHGTPQPAFPDYPGLLGRAFA